MDAPPRELLAAYGENDLARQQIPLGSGTVKVQGSGIPADHTVWVAGRQVPVDPRATSPRRRSFRRARIRSKSRCSTMRATARCICATWSSSAGTCSTSASPTSRCPRTARTGRSICCRARTRRRPTIRRLDGRLAFYVNGKVSERWRLTASADTREGPVKDLFSNFLDKSPDSLFRRIDPDYHFPTFGDDGVVEEMAPTLGKFYVKASRGENYGMWGNFNVGYMGNELAHVDRGLYGANAHYGSAAHHQLWRATDRRRRIRRRTRNDAEL